MESGGNAMSSIITAISTAFTSIQTDAVSLITAIVPIALAIFGTVWLVKKVPGWFKGVTKG